MELRNRTLKIAICDDEKAICFQLESKINKILKNFNVKAQIDIWFSGEGVINYLAKGNYIDLIFLDIQLIKITGIDVGSYIRNDMENIKTQIVYISSKTSYALQLFKTQPFDFLVKPITDEELYQTIKGVLKLFQDQNDLFEFSSGREIYQIKFSDILYFKSNLHKIIIVTPDKEIEFYGKLKNIAEFAPVQFLTIHKSYLVNRDYVEKYAFDYVQMRNKDILTISKPYQKSIREILSHSRKDKYN